MYTEKQARELVIQAGNMLVEKGLVARTWGNVSARCGEHEMIITPSGIAYDILTADKLVKVNTEDLSYEGDVKPSSEKGIHAAVYEMRDEVNFVIHTHQQYASAIAAEEMDLPYAPCAKYGLPGREGLRKNVVSCVDAHRNHKMFLLAKHGALLVGENMEEAFNLADMLELNCKEDFRTRIPDTDPVGWAGVNLDAFRTDKFPYVKLVQDEFVAECMRAGIKVRPYLDDFAQMVGPDMSVIECGSKVKLDGGMAGRNAIIVKGVGAVCVGNTEDDCEAVASIVSKNCAAACYVRKAAPLSLVDALLQRYVYLTKYSKKKDG